MNLMCQRDVASTSTYMALFGWFLISDEGDIKCPHSAHNLPALRGDNPCKLTDYLPYRRTNYGILFLRNNTELKEWLVGHFKLQIC